ncbi:hypothetical protein BGX38DRAFT_648380 [Terfezia claveryi]|nr:hypothetical protein BGX38DRAFT_648380 [Terfezia claveryi]
MPSPLISISLSLLLLVSTVIAQSPRVDVDEDSIPALSQPLEHTFVPLTATLSNLPSKPSTTPILSSTWQSSYSAPPTRTFLPITATTVIIGSDPTTGVLPPSYDPESYEPQIREETSDRLLNLYFLLLAVGVVTVFAVVWVVKRRRKRYPLPRIPERAATTTRPSGSGRGEEAVGGGLPRYDDVVDIPRASENGRGSGSGNGAGEVVSTPPAVGTVLPAMHITALPPMERP